VTIDVEAVHAAIEADLTAALTYNDLGELRMMYAVMAGRCNGLAKQVLTVNEAIERVEERFAEMAVEVARKAVLADREVTAAQLRRQGVTVEFAPWGEK
jgi:hypothetical protein